MSYFAQAAIKPLRKGSSGADWLSFLGRFTEYSSSLTKIFGCLLSDRDLESLVNMEIITAEQKRTKQRNRTWRRDRDQVMQPR